ncbi:MAG: hypothetical protein LBK76_09850 [Verrucomicrobiales bacterium]|nr:hypothetical protein [Verrucomicrobiales bacterium]
MTNNLRKGMPAARCSPVAGPFATNHSAKWWRLRSPAGMVYQVHNLQLFCRQQFEENWRRAAAGLRQVIRWQEGKTKRTVSVYKGWGIARGENLTTPK